MRPSGAQIRARLEIAGLEGMLQLPSRRTPTRRAHRGQILPVCSTCCSWGVRAPGVSVLPGRGHLTWLTWELGSITAVPGHALCPELRELRCPMEGGSPWAGGVPGAHRGGCTLCRGSWCSRARSSSAAPRVSDPPPIALRRFDLLRVIKFSSSRLTA